MPRRKVLHKGWLTVCAVKHRGRTHEIVKLTNSVVVLIYVKDLDSVVFVRQSRPIAKKRGNRDGWTLELPAGRFDRKLTVKELAIDEVLMETGVKLDKKQIRVLNRGRSLYLSVGALTEKSYLCFAKITSEQIDFSKVEFGDKNEGECTTRVLIPLKEVEKIPLDSMSTLSAINWLLRKKEKGAL